MKYCLRYKVMGGQHQTLTLKQHWVTCLWACAIGFFLGKRSKRDPAQQAWLGLPKAQPYIIHLMSSDMLGFFHSSQVRAVEIEKNICVY